MAMTTVISNTTSSKTAAQQQQQLPPAVTEHYKVICPLGKGGFGYVMLARRQNQSRQLVAIKVAGGSNINNDNNGKELNTATTGGTDYKETRKEKYDREMGYAHREIDILRALQHDNIVKLVDFWDPSCAEDLKSTSPATVMALSYAAGPTVEHLLRKGGALSIPFARTVLSQLIDAVAYLHSRAVVHRDIKPDNIIVTFHKNDNDNDDFVWDKRVSEPETAAEWEALRQKYHVTLIDFGFARALTPADMKKLQLESHLVDVVKNNHGGTTTRLTNEASSHEDGTETVSSGSSINSNEKETHPRPVLLTRSPSHLLLRRMSALGSRNYAAPEIRNNVVVADDVSSHHHHHSSSSSAIDITRTLSRHVSYYGLLVDAYSIGNTARYCLTGVAPGEDLEQTLALYNHPIAKLGRAIRKRLQSSTTTKGGKCTNPTNVKEFHRIVKYRVVSQVPSAALHLIRGLTNPDPAQRMSVRNARNEAWIFDVLPPSPPAANNNSWQLLQHQHREEAHYFDFLPLGVEKEV